MQSKEVIVTYLEMTDPPLDDSMEPPSADLHVQLWSDIDLQLYIQLHQEVGGPYLWFERINMNTKSLLQILQHPNVKVFLLYRGSEIAGFCELDGRQLPALEVSYFGLRPQFVGNRLGPYFLDRMLRTAWQDKPDRIWLHTDTNDHPKALAMYQRAGFVIYQQLRMPL